MYILSFWNL